MIYVIWMFYGICNIMWFRCNDIIGMYSVIELNYQLAIFIYVIKVIISNGSIK